MAFPALGRLPMRHSVEHVASSRRATASSRWADTPRARRRRYSGRRDGVAPAASSVVAGSLLDCFGPPPESVGGNGARLASGYCVCVQPSLHSAEHLLFGNRHAPPRAAVGSGAAARTTGRRLARRVPNAMARRTGAQPQLSRRAWGARRRDCIWVPGVTACSDGTQAGDTDMRGVVFTWNITFSGN